MEKVVVKIIANPQFIEDVLPKYQTELASGADLYADIEHPVMLQSLDRHTFMTGIKIALLDGYEAQVRPRSGLARKYGILAAPGTIDADYRGEIGVTLINHSKETFVVQPGERIAQLVIVPVKQAEWDIVTELDKTARGEGGFGSTGK